VTGRRFDGLNHRSNPPAGACVFHQKYSNLSNNIAQLLDMIKTI
jgi:hypothetical protein